MPPQIKSQLQAPELTSRQNKSVQKALADCLAADKDHITPKSEGDHVKAIQDALNTISRKFPDLKIPMITDPPGKYQGSTINAVLFYKSLNGIVRTGQPLDNIVGRMTITQIDNDLLSPSGRKPSNGQVVIDAVPVEIATQLDNLSKDDLAFLPANPANLSGKQLRLLIDMRTKSTTELEKMMVDDLKKGDLRFGPMLANDFFKNQQAPSASFTITHGAGSDFSNMVARTEVWQAHSLAFRTQLDVEIKRLGVKGPFPAAQLVGKVPPPIPSWSPGGLLNAVGPGIAIIARLRTEAAKMLVLIGSFQGSRVSLHEFQMNNAARTYEGTLFYELFDHFGVDTSDIIFDGRGHGTDSQVAFWVLQHERHNPGHMPYRLKVVIKESIQGKF